MKFSGDLIMNEAKAKKKEKIADEFVIMQLIKDLNERVEHLEKNQTPNFNNEFKKLMQ